MSYTKETLSQATDFLYFIGYVDYDGSLCYYRYNMFVDVESAIVYLNKLQKETILSKIANKFNLKYGKNIYKDAFVFKCYLNNFKIVEQYNETT